MATNGERVRFLNMLAYFAVAAIGLALLAAWLLKDGQIGGALSIIASVLADIVVACYAFFYAKSKRNIAWMIVWALAVILIIVFRIL
jgi:heme/copper-type cytochrome/quinol oxidase subunit 4